MRRNLKSVADMAESCPFSEGALRWMLFNCETNGLRDANVVVKIGRRVFIDQDAFDRWIDKQNTRLSESDRKHPAEIPTKTIRGIVEQSCGRCDYEESDGSLLDHCNDCCRKIVKELWALSHQ